MSVGMHVGMHVGIHVQTHLETHLDMRVGMHVHMHVGMLQVITARAEFTAIEVRDTSESNVHSCPFYLVLCPPPPKTNPPTRLPHPPPHTAVPTRPSYDAGPSH